jgi:isoquinoline 1-oxidoreductase subunit beta
MSASKTVDRRQILKAGVSGGAALILGFWLPKRGEAQSPAPAPGGLYKANAWISIASDDRITLLTEIPEMGQGTRTANAMMLADELEADWTTIRVEQAPTIPAVYQHLGTGGSGGTAQTWEPMRQAGAQARAMLLAAAAAQWNTVPSECQASNGSILHISTGRRLRYGELVATASTLPPVKPEQAPLKDPRSFRYIGKPMPRVDTPGKVNGSAVFGIDVRVPGLLFAVIARCPHFGGELANCDDTQAKAVRGVRRIFVLPPIGWSAGVARNIHVAGGVCVVADSSWAAIEGRKALKLTWNKGPGAEESSASLRAAVERQAAGPPTAVAADSGDALNVLAQSPRRVEAAYELPFQAHATMEPMNATAHVHGDGTIEVWAPTQIPGRRGGSADTQSEIAGLAGVPPEKVTVHTTFSGGSFGRRYQWDFAAEAWQAAREMKVPVQLLWTREDDFQHDFYRQYFCYRLSGALDDHGNIAAWQWRTVSTSIGPVFHSSDSMQDPKQVASGEIDSRLPYRTLSYRADYAPVDSIVPRAWWRSVSSSASAFAIECFVDELAHAAGMDPYQFRLRNLRTDQGEISRKTAEVLKLAADRSGWGQALPPGQGRGIACYQFGKTWVAQVAEVSVDKAGKVRVNRVVAAVDCGLAINPDSVRALIEGGINYALTPVLSGEITVKEGAVEQSNFHDYRVLRMADAPEIEVHIVPGGKDPGDGVGESGVPPTAPAVANAIFAATGKRLRRLPIHPEDLKTA